MRILIVILMAATLFASGMCGFVAGVENGAPLVHELIYGE